MATRTVSPETLFLIFQAEITKWPKESLRHRDEPTRNGNIVRDIGFQDGTRVMTVELDATEHLLRIIYPQYLLQ